MMVPEKRYEYRFDSVVYNKRFGIIQSVQWRDTLYRLWYMKASVVVDHLHREVIKDRTGTAKDYAGSIPARRNPQKGEV